MVFMNVRSLKKHWKDIEIDPEFNQCKLLGLSETWLNKDESIGLQSFPVAEFENAGNVRGTAVFAKDLFLKVKKESGTTFSLISVDMSFCVGVLRVINVYLSQKADYHDFLYKLRPELSKDIPTILIGDMNFHYSEGKHVVKDYLEDTGFKQMIHKATHDDGNTIDHLYVYPRDLLADGAIYLKTLYFSDHDAICIRV